jgi:hypothetical protein
MEKRKNSTQKSSFIHSQNHQKKSLNCNSLSNSGNLESARTVA